MDSTLKLGYTEISPNYSWYIEKAPQNVLNELKIQIDKLQFNFSKGEKANNDLKGEIEHEYRIFPLYQTKQYIKDLSQLFENESQYMVSNYNPLPTLKCDDIWVNFQKKHEYNPMHNHSGIYSFVIWYQVPYTFENELKYHHSSQNCSHGEFQFILPPFNKNTTVYSEPIPIDKSKEGYVVIFPSQLPHLVYPFYSSDEYRITVAGNISNSKW